MSATAPPILPLGEAAWTVALGDTVGLELLHRVTALAQRIRVEGIPSVIEIVPAYAAVTVFFDPRTGDANALRDRLAELAVLPSEQSSPSAAAPAPLITIPVRYDGPDLVDVAKATGLSEAEVVRRHVAPEYRVYLLGFAPGWAYLGDLDPGLVLPRRTQPRTRVPAGSVAIGGAQTGVYPLVTPGGWHLIGSTQVKMFDPGREPAALLSVGDRVRFEPAK